MPNGNGNTTLRDRLAVLASLIVLAALATLVILQGADGDIQAYSDFITLLVPAMIGGMWLTNQKQNAKNEEIHDDVNTIKKRVNGELDAKFNSIHERLDAAAVPRVSPSADPTFDLSE